MKKLFKKMTIEKDIQAFWLSFIICLLACVVILFVVAPITGLSQNFGSGNDGYIQLARSIVAGNGYRFESQGPLVFHRPPAYPVFLIPIALFPESIQRYIIILPQSLLVGITGFLIFKIARKLFNVQTARIALFLFLINPWLYWNAKNPMTAIFQMTIYLLFVYVFGALFNKLLIENKKSNYIYLSVFTGFVSGTLCLSHGAMLPVSMLLLFVLFVAGCYKKNKNAIVATIVAVGITLSLIAPWTYRNYKAFDRIIPIAGGGGLAYFNGNVHWDFIEKVPQQKGESYIDASMRIIGIEGTEKTHTHWKGFKDLACEDIANKAMFEDIKSRPVIFVKKLILNAVEYYFPAATYHFLAIKNITAESIVLTIFHLGLWIFAFAGMIFSRSRNIFLMLVVVFMYAIWYFPFATHIGHSLYTLGTIPMLSILAAIGISSLQKKISN